jgi:uncharacterized membrane protein
MEKNTYSKIAEGKTIAIIAYLTLIGLIVAFAMNSEKKNPFASYHIRQSLGLLITSFAVSFVNIIPILGWIVSIFGFIVLLVLWITGLIQAVNGKEQPIPLLGNLYSKWFANI